MNELVAVEIENENLWWAKLGRCSESNFARINHPQPLALVDLKWKHCELIK
jgi:hypothetical protein